MNYKVFADGGLVQTKSCKIYPAPYNNEDTMEYAIINISGKTEIEIQSKIKVDSVIIRPLSAKIPFYTENGKIYISLDKPSKISVEINGGSKNNLMIFAQKERTETLNENSIIIKKNEQNSGTLFIDKDNTTVYIEDGAVLEGNIYAKNCSNLTICGYGRICMENYTYEMRKDFARSIDIFNCKNVSIRDIIIDDSNDWSMRINECDGVNIDNVKIFGCRGNSDGIDICGSRNVTVTDIFTRVWDDSFVVKALEGGNTENVLFKNSVLWNDFARPMEVGVELRADRVRNIRFENIDIIHSSTGYPLMGIHHGDHAEVSDIVFNDIRIEDTPGAQLFDMRIADSVWSRDTGMGNIRNITFSNINYMGTEDNNVLLSNSRIEGFSREHDIENVRFHNIMIKGKAVKSLESMGIDIYDYVENVSVTSDIDAQEAALLSCDIKLKEKSERDGFVSLCVNIKNDTDFRISGTAYLDVSPKNMTEMREIQYNLSPGESADYDFNIKLQAGKYVFYLRDSKNQLKNKWLYTEICAYVAKNEDIKKSPCYRFINYYGIDSVSVKLGVCDNKLLIMNSSNDKVDFVLYTAMPVKENEGEVLFSAEETDFGEVCAVVKKGEGCAAAPQLRCPAEITYVFKNEPKVKEIIKTDITLKSGEIKEILMKNLGIENDAEEFIMELAAKTDETEKLRYPYTLFHSTMPEKTAHMFGRIKIIKKES